MDSANLSDLLILGVFLLIGWGAHVIGSRVHVPRVTLLLSVGLLAGPAVLDLVPAEIAQWFPMVSQIALAMIGFLLGESLVGRELKQRARTVLFVSIGATLGPILVVTLLLLLIGTDLALALLLAGIATATAPAAIVDVVHETAAEGPLTETTLGVVAIDDAWGVMLFSLLLVAIEAMAGTANPLNEILWGVWEVLGALLLGGLIGIPMAWSIGRMRPGEPTLIEAAGFVLLCAGLAIQLHASYLLACMALGATVAVRAKHHTRPFRDIEGVSEPFLVIFFLLAGHEFNLATLRALGIIGGTYVLARSLGKIAGAAIGARLAQAPPVVQARIGWCLLPQAGVALGLALLVAERLPDLGYSVLPLVIASTVLFELFGPLLTRWQLARAGETE